MATGSGIGTFEFCNEAGISVDSLLTGLLPKFSLL